MQSLSPTEKKNMTVSACSAPQSNNGSDTNIDEIVILVQSYSSFGWMLEDNFLFIFSSK